MQEEVEIASKVHVKIEKKFKSRIKFILRVNLSLVALGIMLCSLVCVGHSSTLPYIYFSIS